MPTTGRGVLRPWDPIYLRKAKRGALNAVPGNTPATSHAVGIGIATQVSQIANGAGALSAVGTGAATQANQTAAGSGTSAAGSPTYVGFGFSTGATNSITGLQVGDFVIRIGWPYGGLGAGWGTPLATSSLNPMEYKNADATDVASGWSTSGQTIDFAFAYRGVASFVGVTASVLDYITAYDGTRPKTLTGITTTVNDSRVIYVFLGVDDNTVAWTGATERADVNTTVATDSTYSLADLLQATAGSVASVSAQQSAATDSHLVFALILQP